MDFGELNLSDFSRRSKSLEGSEGGEGRTDNEEEIPVQARLEGSSKSQGEGARGAAGSL